MTNKMPPVSDVSDTGVIVKIAIENHYPEDGDVIKTEWAGEVPTPPAPEGTEAYDDWAYDNLFSKTGTGREEGDSAYFVEVIESSAPEVLPVGTEFEWGT